MSKHIFVVASALFSFAALSATGCALAQQAAPAPATDANGLPPGPGQQLVSQDCSQCHGLGVVTSMQNTREEWNDVLDQMVNNGLNVSDADRAVILDYLSTNFRRAAADGASAK